MKFVRQLKPKLSDDAEVIIFYQDKLLINNKNQRFIHSCKEFNLFFDINDLIAIALKDSKTICTVDIAENLFLDLDDYDFVDLRMILGSLDQESDQDVCDDSDGSWEDIDSNDDKENVPKQNKKKVLGNVKDNCKPLKT